MKSLRLAGMLLVVLGIASLFVPVPHAEKQGIQAAGMDVGAQTSHGEPVSLLVSAMLIAGGIALGNSRKAYSSIGKLRLFPTALMKSRN